MLKIGVITMALMSFLHAGWLSDLFDDTPTPPISIPIDLSQAGSVAETEVRVKEDDNLDFRLLFVKNKENREKLDWLYEFVGWPAPMGKGGVVIPVELTIWKQINQSKSPHYEAILFTEGVISSGTYITRQITTMRLPSGTYIIRLKNLEAHSELKETPVYVGIKYFRAPK